MKNEIENGISGIYGIKYKDEIIYVGQSKNVRQRINAHFKWQTQINEIYRKGLKTQAQRLRLQFYKFIGEHQEDISPLLLEECNLGKLNDQEEYWIKHYKPRFNYEGVVIEYGVGKRKVEACAWE